MKRLLAFLLCITLIFALSACKKDKLLEGEEVLFDINSTASTSSEEASSTDSSTAASSSSQSESSSQASSNTSSNSKPTVSVPEEEIFETGMELVSSGGVYFPDINRSYKYAAEIYADLKNFTFSYDEQLGSFEIVKDGSTGYYWRVNDDRFDSVAELERYLDAFFTKECQKTFYDPTRFIDYNGHLYASLGTVADSQTYAGCSFKLTKQTTKRIYFTGTAYYYKNINDADPSKLLFTIAPADTSKFTTRTVEFEMQSTEDGMNWQFTKFGYLG